MTTEDKKAAASHYARTRKELAGALGYDVDRLTAAQELRLDNVVALKLVSDTLRASLLRGEQVDHRELLSVNDGLQRLLPREREPEAVIDDGDDPHERLMEIIEGWIEADKANKLDEQNERVAQGLPADPKDARIAQLEAENARLRGDPKLLAAPSGIPESEREPKVITPRDCNVIEPFKLYNGPPPPGPDDPPKRSTAVIDHGPAPTAAEREAKRLAINNDRSEFYRQGLRPAGTEAWRPHTWRFE